MADESPRSDSLSPARKGRSGTAGDVPDDLRRRYFVDARGGAGLGFYADATVTRPAFRDLGARLVAERSDPRTIRDLTAIARHRGWTIVVTHGATSFRREAWLEGRAAGLEVRGYRPTDRDLQALERRLGPRADRGPPTDPQGRSALSERAQSTLNLVETVVRNRISGEQRQDRILASARQRISAWLERGAERTLSPGGSSPPLVTADRRRERHR